MTKGAARQRSLRCAIYTRKSSEEGLEQEFNSLHAQREACEAYIQSQRHEGWTCLAETYDDGGLSGGTMERPALQRLLADIAAGAVDAVIVYKVDRLTRSLADFAKIVEVFDGKGVSFVSVTQQFNTTTSMGRLTLNVLLSFAQFEREVTGERIRDKIAASKKKGMWMGGVPPLGYEPRDRKLAVVESEAETVRHIFQRYAALGSVLLLQQELEAQGITSKRWTSASGRLWGGKPIARGALYLMLQNRVYRGEIMHKDQAYPGEHAAIIEAALWDDVQAKLASNTAERSAGRRRRSPSLLAGFLYDGEGHRMTPTHAVKNGTRYRYYVSRPLITRRRDEHPTGLRIPAAEIEQIVMDRIGQLLAEPSQLFEAVSSQIPDPAEQQRVLKRAAERAATWSEPSELRSRSGLLPVIQRIEVRIDRVDIHILPSRLVAWLWDQTSTLATMSTVDERMLILSAPARLRRAGLETRMIVDGPVAPGRATRPDATLIKLIARAHSFRDKLMQAAVDSLADLARGENLTGSYFTRLVRLAYLAPDITTAIIEGRQPRDLTAQTLLGQSRLPLSWPEQRILLGFV